MKPRGPGGWRESGLMAAAVTPLAVLAVLAALGVAVPRAMQGLAFTLAVLWFAMGWVLTARLRAHRLRLLSSLLQGLREGDYSARVRSGRGTIGAVWREFNALAAHLGGEQRHGLETDALLSQLLASLDLAVVIVDERDRLIELNPAAEALLGEASGLIGRTATELGLSEWLQRGVPFIERRDFPTGAGPREVRRVTFRRRGRPHRLLVIADVSRTLRDEERHAWRRLIRVLGHEINNSLGSIQSTAESLRARAPDADPALREGLELIERRSRTLGGFIRRYAELARLPPPHPEMLDITDLIRDVAALEERIAVRIETDAEARARVDRPQFEQALINLVRNAADAALETGGGVRIRWREEGRSLLLEVEDDGPGIAQSDNLFVPFFTTKRGGSGIGLVLARQIIEAHGGTLRLTNRENARGVWARIRVPRE